MAEARARDARFNKCKQVMITDLHAGRGWTQPSECVGLSDNVIWYIWEEINR